MNPSLFASAEISYSTIDFSDLIAQLKQVGRELTLDKGMILRPSNNGIVIVIDGTLTVEDAQEGGMAIGHTFRLMPVGLMERYYGHIGLAYRAETPISAIQLTPKEFDAVFLHTEANTSLFGRIMTHLALNLVHVFFERSGNSGFSTIRLMLYRYQHKATEGTLHNEGIATFILRRTRLSKSYVYQILSSLKIGGYITVHNGKLITINKTIPERY
ncbi:helix-turn-helix domain-containing protein [Buttiauxella sp. B2]|uniref:helix-turn-helix domain-containing protein n=1 Tax=Buttiauxella sp. B2 TaxID=2587812 RepID=UPI001674E468|nr:helix-turn-helix domain-containing protein [Buttiauxella sp. B2]